MKQLLVLLLAFITSCTSPSSNEQQQNNHANDDKAATVPLNNGAKWKADSTTKKNVAALVQIVNDNTYQDAGKRKALSVSLRNQLDTLIKQCGMKDAEHEALHVWLKKVLNDVKELEKGKAEYNEVRAELKKDVESFYASFE